MPIEQIKIKQAQKRSPRNVARFHATHRENKEERKEKPEEKKKSRKGFKPLGLLLKLGTVGVLFSFILSLGAYAYFSQGLPNVDDLFTRNVAQSTKIYDRTGKQLLY